MRCTYYFFYAASSGPEFCEPDDDEVDFCNGLEDEDFADDRGCEPDEFCTSPCQCWDGEMQRVTDIEEFTGITIQDQGKG